MSATDAPDRTLPDLVGELSRAALGLVRSVARIFGFELRDVARRFGRRVALLVVSAVCAAVGFLLLLGAAALLAQELLHVPAWAALAALGVATLGAGALGMRGALRRLGDADLAFPATIAELDKDAEALASPRTRR